MSLPPINGEGPFDLKSESGEKKKERKRERERERGKKKEKENTRNYRNTLDNSLREPDTPVR